MKVYNNYISYKDIISHIDIEEGDIVNVSSDVLKLICVCRENNEAFDSNAFIDTIIKKIGNTGTLLFPTYYWRFCKGDTFDYRNTLSQTGGLSNVALGGISRAVKSLACKMISSRVAFFGGS